MRRHLLYSVIIVLFVVLCSCRKHTQSSVQIAETSVIKLNDCLHKIAGTETLNLCFDSVLEDSRCPKNVQCVWAGAARVKLTLSSKDFTQSFALSSLNAPPRYIRDTVLQGYNIQFINLYPYPGDTPSQVQAEVKITKL